VGFLNKIFKQSSGGVKWYKVFDTIEQAEKIVPLNKAVTLLVENQKICLTRTHDSYHAVTNACPHLGAPLSKGTCNALGEIVCPWHNYRFNLKLGHETSGQGNGLGIEIYKVEFRKDGLYVGI
jgi:nitrite reductase/ring-hydroxylating ferredoxin subunit